MTDPDPCEEPRPRRLSDPTDFQVVSYLWTEYQYRHDMVWKPSFRVTAVAAALLIAPFLAEPSVVIAVGKGLLALPALAIVVIASGLFTLQSELGRLDVIRKAYGAAQRDVLGPYVSAKELKTWRVTPDKPKKPEKPKEPEKPKKPEKLDDLWERLWRRVGPLWGRVGRLWRRIRTAVGRRIGRLWRQIGRLWRQIGSLQFAQRVRLYLVVLLVAAIVYFVLLWVSWLPVLVDEARRELTRD